VAWWWESLYMWLWRIFGPLITKIRNLSSYSSNQVTKLKNCLDNFPKHKASFVILRKQRHWIAYIYIYIKTITRKLILIGTALFDSLVKILSWKNCTDLLLYFMQTAYNIYYKCWLRASILIHQSISESCFQSLTSIRSSCLYHNYLSE
jgi:hypothetical protein